MRPKTPGEVEREFDKWLDEARKRKAPSKWKRFLSKVMSFLRRTP